MVRKRYRKAKHELLAILEHLYPLALQERYGQRTAMNVSDTWSEEDLYDLMQASLAHAERTIWAGGGETS